ncbi:MAG: hypothetical protein VYB90_02555 [Actinomycetota bacterium]|nr:hypothetical protein [Actinomycetota bacterium]
MNGRFALLLGIFGAALAVIVTTAVELTATAPQGRLTLVAFGAPAGIALLVLGIVTALARTSSGDGRGHDTRS